MVQHLLPRKLKCIVLRDFFVFLVASLRMPNLGVDICDVFVTRQELGAQVGQKELFPSA